MDYLIYFMGVLLEVLEVEFEVRRRKIGRKRGKERASAYNKQNVRTKFVYLLMYMYMHVEQHYLGHKHQHSHKHISVTS